MTNIEEAEIKGRTDAMLWIQALAMKWRREALKEDEYADFYNDFAEELEERISSFANT